MKRAMAILHFFKRIGVALTGFDWRTKSVLWACAAVTIFPGVLGAWTSGTYGTNCGRVVGLYTDIGSDGVFSVTLHDGSTASQEFFVDSDYDTMSFIHASLLAAKTAGLDVCLDVDNHDYVLLVTVQ